MKYLFYFICGLIAYGSLYPFEFSLTELSVESWRSFAASWFVIVSKGDLLGNLVLFAPFGFFAFFVLHSEKLQFKITMILFAAFLFGLLLQLGQLFIPARDPVLVDVIVNVLGAAAGAAFACTKLGKHAIKASYGIGHLVDTLLLGCWTMFLLSPFVPTIDFSKYKDALKPLLFEHQFSVPSFLLITAGWLVAFRLIDRVRPATSKGVLFTIIVLSWLLKIIIVNAELTLHDMVAGLLVMAMYMLLPAGLLHNSRGLIVLLLGTLFIDGLRPFEFSSALNNFYWLPFEGGLTGSIDANVAAIGLKLFLFGSIIWLQLSAGKRVVGLAALLFVTVSLLEVLQLWLVGRTPEITDPMMVIVVAWLLGKFRELAQQHPVAQSKPVSAHVQTQPGATAGLAGNFNNYREALLLLALGCALLVVAMLALLQMPNIPYNVKELFRFDANGVDLLFFALALLVFGAGGGWVGQALTFSSRPWLAAPCKALAVCLVIYFCMLIAVTKESIADVSGSANIVYQLTEKQILGRAGQAFVEYLGKDSVHQAALIFEPVIRFSALIMPAILFVGLFVSLLLRRQDDTAVSADLRQFLLNCAYLLPWFLLAKIITFDFSSTDNLNELIARKNELGINGGPYLYALLVIITLHAAAIATAFVFKQKRAITTRVLLFFIAVPVGWLLINAGLVEAFKKYSDTYSGVDFLLGPDRENKLTDQTLMLRWVFVQVAATLLLCYGAIIFLRIYLVTRAVNSDSLAITTDTQPVSVPACASAPGTLSQNDAVLMDVNLEGRHIDSILKMASDMGISTDQALQHIIDQARVLEGNAVNKLLACGHPTESGELYLKKIKLTSLQALWVEELAQRYRVAESTVVRHVLDHYFRHRRSLMTRLKNLLDR